MSRWFVDRSPQRGIPSVSLRRLLPDARFVGCHDWEVSGCSADSRRLDPGQIFVAVSGPEQDGHDFVAQALERGAAGVVVERPCAEAGRLQVVVPDSRLALARLCHALAGEPSRQLRLVAVAGDSGKTVTSLFVRAILEANGSHVGLIGPRGWSDGQKLHPAGKTPPGADNLALMLAAMVERGCDGGVIQVPDEALRDRCFEGIAFDLAVITGFDAEESLAASEALLARRRRAAGLVRMLMPGGVAVVNADDRDAELLGAVNLDARRVSFGIREAADVTAKVESLGPSGTRLLLRGFERETKVQLTLVGSKNVERALAAAAVAWADGLSADVVAAGLEAVRNVAGHLERIEPVDSTPLFEVRVDRARTAAELRQALAALREICPGKVACVVGAEGLTERSLRLDLARAAEHSADRVILTTNNPRTEDPDQIVDDLLAGFRRPGRVRVEPDRRLAIELALSEAQPGDAVLIAGKGRNTFQIFADHAAPFDDREVVDLWLRQNQTTPRRTSA